MASPVSAASLILRRGASIETQIRRNAVAGLNQHDVAAHDLGCRNRVPPAVPDDDGFQSSELPERGHHALGAIVLHKADRAVQHDDGQDNDRVTCFANDPGDERSRDQNQNHEILKLRNDHPEDAARPPFANFVRPFRDEAARRLR